MKTVNLEYGKCVDVREWDGISPGGWSVPHYDGGLMIDSNGSVYYQIRNGRGLWAVWCGAGQLDRHVHRLEQIAARR